MAATGECVGCRFPPVAVPLRLLFLRDRTNFVRDHFTSSSSTESGHSLPKIHRPSVQSRCSLNQGQQNVSEPTSSPQLNERYGLRPKPVGPSSQQQTQRENSTGSRISTTEPPSSVKSANSIPRHGVSLPGTGFHDLKAEQLPIRLSQEANQHFMNILEDHRSDEDWSRTAERPGTLRLSSLKSSFSADAQDSLNQRCCADS